MVVDDGLVTGATMVAAVRSLRHEHPAQIIVAVPVGTADSIAELQAEADAVICLQVPEWIASVGQCYEEPGSPDDAQVMQYLQKAAQGLADEDQDGEKSRVPVASGNVTAARHSPGM